MANWYQKLKFSDFVDLLLACLYRLEAQYGSRFYDLSSINEGLRDPGPQQWVFDAGKYLQSRGHAQVLFRFGGRCQGQLTGEGRIYIEGKPGILEQLDAQFKPEFFGEKEPAPLSADQERTPATDTVRQLRDAIQADQSLSLEQKEDLSKDVESIQQQVLRREPNLSALAALLEPMSRYPGLAQIVSKLASLLNQGVV